MRCLPEQSYVTWCAAIVVGMVGCSSPSTPRITPVDPELNHRLLTGEGLDARLNSRTEAVQYYEVAYLDDLAPEAAQATLDRFLRRQYTRADLTRLQQLTVLFYRSTLWANYRAEAHEAARDDEVGFLAEHRDALAAQVRLVKLHGPDQRWRRSRVLYRAQTVPQSAVDTARIDQLFNQ